MWAYKLLRTKHFHGVSSGNQPPYLLKSRYGKVRYARGDVHENRAECLFSLFKPYLRVFRGISKTNLPGSVSFFQFLRNFRYQHAFEQTELILWAA
jgi:hypothetical protein